MDFGVTRIAFPGSDWGADVRTDAAAGNGLPVADRIARESNSFVAGPENQLAVPALELLLAGDNSTGDDLETAAAIFNPLVLLGSTGTGKSHLARGVVRRWRALLGESAVVFFTAVDFARELRGAREEDRLASFREQLAGCRMLVIEDLHRIPRQSPSSRDQMRRGAFVQRELRDTLDILADSGAVVVATSQHPPAAMTQLDAGLRDRLSGGLTVRLQPPGIEARRELLREAAAARGSELGEEQLEQLAQKIEGTVAQLQRAIAEYDLDAQSNSKTVGTLENATGENAAGFAATSIASARDPITLKQIVAVVARYYSLTQAAMRSSARRKSLVHARGIAIYLSRSLTDLSYTKIGQGLGGRDHSTVMHATRTIEKMLANDATTQRDVEELKRILTAV